MKLYASPASSFARAVKPLHDEARERFGEEMFALLKA